MAIMANWNGHTFEVSPKLIRSFTDLNIKGSCETTTKNTDKQKYVEHKYGEIPEIIMTVSLNALTGVTDVYAEAMEYVQEAEDGACAYFYLGGKKLLPAQMMLVSAEIAEIAFMPGRGDLWISCDVKLKFQQGGDSDGASTASSGGEGGGSEKASVLTSNLKDLLSDPDVKETLNANISKLKSQVAQAQAASNSGFYNFETGEYTKGWWSDRVDKAIQEKSSAQKTAATTGRNCEITVPKITRIPGEPGMNVKIGDTATR